MGLSQGYYRAIGSFSSHSLSCKVYTIVSIMITTTIMVISLVTVLITVILFFVVFTFFYRGHSCHCSYMNCSFVSLIMVITTFASIRTNHTNNYKVV